jgi:glycosyltransferase involved in cell wall biosynthesis
MKICVIVNIYPNCIKKYLLVFVQQLVSEWAKKDVDCTVICPLALNLNYKYKKVPYLRIDKTEGKDVTVYFPKFFGLGQVTKIFGKSVAPFTTKNFTRSVSRVIKNENLDFDIIYSHFITPAGMCAAIIGNKMNIPTFVAYGEEDERTIDQLGEKNIRIHFQNIKGVIAVSSKNANILINRKIVSKEKIHIFPNGYNPNKFYSKNKKECRRKLGLDENQFIVGFCGSFDDRKGILRLEKAIDNINDVYFICAGSGKSQPKSKKCLIARPWDNSDLVDFYNSLDIFVLPTLNEGCCNAIIEAMACGIPIISSNLSFNFDILDDTNSIMVDPTNIEEIEKSIILLKNDESLRHKLRIGSIEKAKELLLQKRAENILDYIKTKSSK